MAFKMRNPFKQKKTAKEIVAEMLKKGFTPTRVGKSEELQKEQEFMGGEGNWYENELYKMGLSKEEVAEKMKEYRVKHGE